MSQDEGLASARLEKSLGVTLIVGGLAWAPKGNLCQILAGLSWLTAGECGKCHLFY
jgi:hypothetical protein